MRALASVAALVAVAALAGSAPAKTPGLTATERKALDIVSVRAVGAGDVGLVVTVTFRGNIERALGRGNLANALVTLLLTPAGSAQPTEGLVTVGPGAVGTTLQRPGARRSGVVRSGRRLTFVVDRRAGSLDRIAVKTFASLRTTNAGRRLTVARQTPPPSIRPELWKSITEGIASDEDFARTDRWLEDPDCLLTLAVSAVARRSIGQAERTRTRLEKLDRALGAAVAQLSRGEAKAVERSLRALNSELDDLVGGEISAGAQRDALLAELRQALRTVRALNARNDAAIAGLKALADRADALVDDQPCAITATFSTQTRTTRYSWPVDKGYWYEWVLLPPANDPTCNNRGSLRGTEQTFGWYHGDDVCSHAAEDPGRGHLGTIALTIKAQSIVTCKAVYLGTVSGTGPRATCTVNDRR